MLQLTMSSSNLDYSRHNGSVDGLTKSEFLPLLKYGSDITSRTMPEDDSITESPSTRPTTSSPSDGVPKVVSDLEEGRSPYPSKLEEDGILYLGKDSYIVKRVSSDNVKSSKKTITGTGVTIQDSLTPEQRAIFKENHEMKMKLYKWNRFSGTVDVILSKLFPAGFFWQLAASLCGLPSETLGFAICTGIGEAVGVVSGHILYSYLVKGGGNLTEISQTAIFLGTGTICSGTSWQPIVNALQGASLSFLGVFVGTWIACTYMFNFGLRVGRNLYSEVFVHVEQPTWENSRTDFLLSFTIGGATAFFVGTDTTYLPEENFLIGIVGVHDSFSIVHGAILAGISTALGFGLTQTIFNIVFPTNKNWID